MIPPTDHKSLLRIIKMRMSDIAAADRVGALQRAMVRAAQLCEVRVRDLPANSGAKRTHRLALARQLACWTAIDLLGMATTQAATCLRMEPSVIGTRCRRFRDRLENYEGEITGKRATGAMGLAYRIVDAINGVSNA